MNQNGDLKLNWLSNKGDFVFEEDTLAEALFTAYVIANHQLNDSSITWNTFTIEYYDEEYADDEEMQGWSDLYTWDGQSVQDEVYNDLLVYLKETGKHYKEISLEEIVNWLKKQDIRLVLDEIKIY